MRYLEKPGVIMKSTFLYIALLSFLVGCNPTVKVEAPDKPIEINLNVKKPTKHVLCYVEMFSFHLEPKIQRRDYKQRVQAAL